MIDECLSAVCAAVPLSRFRSQVGVDSLLLTLNTPL